MAPVTRPKTMWAISDEQLEKECRMQIGDRLPEIELRTAEGEVVVLPTLTEILDALRATVGR